MDNATSSHLLTRGIKKKIPATAYLPLEDNNEIRLIAFVSRSTESSLVHCYLETVSLKSYTPEYQTYASSLSSRVSKRKVLTNWARKRSPATRIGEPDHDAIINYVPVTEGYRFLWSEYAAFSYVLGDENKTGTIVLNGHKTQVTCNLEIALHALCGRPDFRDRYCGGVAWAPETHSGPGAIQGPRDLELRRLRKQFDTSFIVFGTFQRLRLACKSSYIYLSA